MVSWNLWVINILGLVIKSFSLPEALNHSLELLVCVVSSILYKTLFSKTELKVEYNQLQSLEEVTYLEPKISWNKSVNVDFPQPWDFDCKTTIVSFLLRRILLIIQFFIYSYSSCLLLQRPILTSLKKSWTQDLYFSS